MAEREGFEPSEEVSPLTRLAGERLQPTRPSLQNVIILSSRSLTVFKDRFKKNSTNIFTGQPFVINNREVIPGGLTAHGS